MKLKTTQNITIEITNIDQTEKKQSSTTEFKERNAASATNRGQLENIDSLKVIHNKFRGRNHETLIQIRRLIEDTIGLQLKSMKK